MEPLLEHYQPTFYPFQTSNKCYPTLKSLCQQLCICQYHLRIHYTFIDTSAHTFSLPTDSFYYLQMFLFRIRHNKYQSTEFSPWTSLMEISQPIMKLTPKYLRITWDETMAVEILDQQYSACKEASGQFYNIYTPFQPLTNPPSCITALYSKNSASIATRCSLQVRRAHTISIPMLIAPNIWLITSLQFTVPTGITLVCPEGPTKLIALQKPIHILQLPPACSATSPYFYLPPHYEPTQQLLIFLWK